MIKSGTNKMLLVIVILALSTTWVVQARPQRLPGYQSPFGKPKPNYFGKPKPNIFSNLGNLGGGWSLGKIPGKYPSANGLNYQTGKWQFGAGVGGPLFKPNYAGAGVSFNL